ncbi:hypothetical protein E2C01_035805 [Portunus trituberculatus]|uniref:Uncharacterized protein n=1 Tax=Portunus trituberculatus TaxID=210409 RepID=A0A5B7F450_PORTR|nr:hypothetical protein [Portunus trituberculatus]
MQYTSDHQYSKTSVHDARIANGRKVRLLRQSGAALCAENGTGRLKRHNLNLKIKTKAGI